VLRIPEPRATAVRELMIHRMPFDIQSHIGLTVTLSLEGDHDRKPLFTQWDEASWGNTLAGRSVRSSTCTNVPIVLNFGADDVFCANACMKQSAGTIR
jgi:hypothetical protein